VEKLAAFINERAEEIRQRTSVVSTLDLVILTLLNITDEMFQREPIQGDTAESEEENHKAIETTEKVV
jgi:cell division protein ZapA (FtsZ GTPase activity inhibitor)